MGEFLAQGGKASVLGVTSSGIFLHNPRGQVCFLSGEAYRGPITINLQCTVHFKALFKVGEGCLIYDGGLSFSGCQVVIPSDTPVWEPLPIRFGQGDTRLALQRGMQLAKGVVGGYRKGLFFPFLDHLVHHSEDLAEEQACALLPGWQMGSELFDWLSGLIGLGRGLTPAGDDFLCGFLLARHALNPSSADDLSERLAAAAQGKTTALSAALIRCAAHGQGDERLLDALHWMAGDGDRQDARARLLSYGSSSGVDALAGMLAALLLC